MLTNEKSLYQAKLILECLPKEEYAQIPQDVISYLETHAEYDENIYINPHIPLEFQNIDEKTYSFLRKVLGRIPSEDSMALEDMKKANESMKEEITKLQGEIAESHTVLGKISKAEELLQSYENQIVEKDERIGKLTEDNVKLRSYIDNTPSWIRKFFMKDINHLLDVGKYSQNSSKNS